jgi:hypothetical protein
VSLRISSVVSTNVHFTPSPVSATLWPFDSTYLYVRFVADSVRTEEGKIILLHNGIARADTINVHAQGVVSVGESANEIPDHFFVDQNYPNPFNPLTTIRYGLPRSVRAKLEVFNLLGQRVAILVHEERAAGYHETVLDGSSLASGVYFYRLQAGEFVQTKKLLLLR